MAAPVINSITVVPDPVLTGQTATITIDASDPDATTVNFTVVVSDAAGNQATGVIPLVISDPLTYSVTASSGTVLPGGSPNVFTWSE